jgi:hypothetical protein
MSITSIQLKKPEIRYQENNIPQARNPIYQRRVRIKCSHCSGKKRIFKTLYSLYYHFREEHGNEYGYKNYVMSLADKLIQGESL